MKIKEIKNTLKNLGFNELCDDNKTLVAYNQIQYFLKSNQTPLKAITKIYLDSFNNLRIVIYNDIDLESGYNLNDENEI